MLVLQRALKKCLGRKREQARVAAALTLQRVYRGYIVRQTVRKQRLLALAEKQVTAVTKIQVSSIYSFEDQV